MKKSLEGLEKINARQISGLVAAFVGCIAPGFLAIYFYRPSLIHELETSKLILFSASITLPIFAINCAGLENFLDRFAVYWDEKTLMGGVILTSMSLYFSLYITLSSNNGLHFKYFFAWVIVAEVCVWVLFYVGKLLAHLFGMTPNNPDIKVAVRAVLAGIPVGYVFDSHHVIDILMHEHPNAYYAFIRRLKASQRRFFAHGQIGKMIAEYEGPAFLRIDKALSKNVNGTTSECTAWKKTESPANC